MRLSCYKTTSVKEIAFVGLGRGKIRRELTRKNMAELIGLPYEEFVHRYAWENLYGEEIMPKSRADDRRRADVLRRRPSSASYSRALMLGDRLAEALQCEDQPRYRWFRLEDTLLAARTMHTGESHWNTHQRGQGAYWHEMRRFLQTEVRG